MRVDLNDAERAFLRSALHTEAVLTGEHGFAAELSEKLQLTKPKRKG